MNPMEVVEAVSEKKLSVVQKYWQLLIIIGLIVSVVYQNRENQELRERLYQTSELRVKLLEEQNKRSDEKVQTLLEINKLSKEAYQQSGTLNNPSPTDRTYNKKSGRNEK